MPAHENYPIVPLDELCDLCSGITKGRKLDSPDTVEVPYMAVANVQDGRLSLDNVKTIEATPEEIERYLLRPGDLLLTEGGDPDKLGRGVIWNGEIGTCIHQNHIFRARKATERIEMAYLARLVSSPYGKRYFLRQSKQTTGIASINMGQLKRFPVPLPPLEEQRRIAAILDKANELIRLRSRHQALSRDIELSIFYNEFGSPVANAFGWPMVPLVEMAEIFSDGPFGSNLKSSHYVDSGIRVVRLQNIGVGVFLDDDKAYVSTSHYETIKKHSCLPGDVLIGTLGDPNLRACILPDGIPVAINKADCIQMRCNKARCTPEYISHLLR